MTERTIPPDLDEFQKEDVRRMAGAMCLGNFNPVGAGKTLEALTCIQTWLKLGVIDGALVVGRKSTLLMTWAAEIEKWFPGGMTYTTVTGDIPWRRRQELWKDLGRNDVVICNWEILQGLKDREAILERMKCKRVAVIGDEIHIVRNWETQLWKAYVSIRELSHRSLGLTGTPYNTNPMDLYGVMSAIGINLGPAAKFQDTFVISLVKKIPNPHPNYYKPYIKKLIPIGFGVDHRPFLEAMLQQNCIRREPKEITLPPLREETRLVEQNAEEKKMYGAFKHEVGADLEGMTESELLQWVDSGFTIHSKLRQILSGKCADKMVPSKDAELLELLPELVAHEQKVIVFSPYRETVMRLERLIKKETEERVVTIHGENTLAQRYTNLKHFQEDVAVKVLLMTTAGGEGLNLQCASRIVFFDRMYNPAAEDQILGRVYRRGQVSECIRINFQVPDTLDEEILTTLKLRRRTMHQVKLMMTRDQRTGGILA